MLPTLSLLLSQNQFIFFLTLQTAVTDIYKENVYNWEQIICLKFRFSAGGRIGTRFLRPRGTSPLKGVNPAGTPKYRNGTEGVFGLKGRQSVVRDVKIYNQPVLRMRRK